MEQNELCKEVWAAQKQYMEPIRNKRLEQALNDFASEVCRKEGVSPPDIVAIPEKHLFVASDGETKVAQYRPCGQGILFNSELPYLFNLAHELAHHIEYKKIGEKRFEEKLKCIEEGIPWEACPTEKRANKAAIKLTVENIDLWKEKVEPLVGKGKIFPFK